MKETIPAARLGYPHRLHDQHLLRRLRREKLQGASIQRRSLRDFLAELVLDIEVKKTSKPLDFGATKAI